MHYILFYDVVDDYLEKRLPFRAEHIDLARKALARGELILAGDLADPADGAILIFPRSYPGAAEEFAKNDNYVKNGLIKNWRVRKWTTVVGEGSSPPKDLTP
jgi:uncharacterized protein